MTRTRKDGSAPPSRAAWEGKAAAFREAAAELQRLTAASASARHLVAALAEWLDRQAKRCDRRATSIRPGRKRDQLAYLANYREPGKAGRPATGARRDETVFGEVERWREELVRFRESQWCNELEQRTGRKPSAAEVEHWRGQQCRPSTIEACRAMATSIPRSTRPTADALYSAYKRHKRRSKNEGE